MSKKSIDDQPFSDDVLQRMAIRFPMSEFFFFFFLAHVPDTNVELRQG